MAYVPCPRCRFLIGPADTTCRWCKVDLEEFRAAKSRLTPPAKGAQAVNFVPGQKRRLGRAAKAPKEPKAPKPAKAPKPPTPDIDLDAIRPTKRPPVPVAAVAPPPPARTPRAVEVAPLIAATAPVIAPSPPVVAPPPPVVAPPVVAPPVPAAEMSVFARLAAPNYLVPPAPPVSRDGYVAPAPLSDTDVEPAAKAPREPRSPGKGAWRYTTATLVTLGIVAASAATASYVLNRPTGASATKVAPTAVATTTAPIAPTKWLRYVAPDGSFTVDMPVTPTLKTAPAAGDPTITETTYDGIKGGTALKVTFYPHAIDPSQVHDLLQSFKNSALTVKGSSLMGELQTTIGGRPALAYTVAQTGTTLFFTEIFDGDRVYTLVSALSAGDSARFVASLVIAPHVPK